MSAINILTAKQSLFLSIIIIFFGTTGNLLAGAKRKEKLWLCKRLHSSQNLLFTEITTDLQDPSQVAGTEEVNQPPCVTGEPGEPGAGKGATQQVELWPPKENRLSRCN